MARALAFKVDRWVALLAVAAGVVACSSPMPPPRPSAPTAPAQPPSPAATAPRPAPAVAPPAVAVPVVPSASATVPTVSPAVAARFPEPAGNYRVPALQAGRTGYTTQDELQSMVRELAASAAPAAQLVSLGSSQRGVALEALLFTQNTDPSAAALQRSGRPTVLLVGQVHGDEPAGAEALLVVAQELARGSLRNLLDRVNVLVLPRVNPDGAQAGTAATANGSDIDRDQLLLGSAEAQALARLLREYQPTVVVQAHEYAVADALYVQKFGAVQRYDALLQYAGTGNLPPFATKAAEEWFREPLLASLKQQGLSTQWAYTTSNDVADKRLSMGGTQADSLRTAAGLRNAVSIVVESRGAGIGRAQLKRRIHTQVVALTSVLQSAAARGADLLKLRQYVDTEVSAQTCQGQVVVEAGLTASEYTLQMLDPTSGAERSINVNWETSLALREVKTRARPCGYWLAADQADAVARLRLLGLRVDKLTAMGVVQGEMFGDGGARQGGALKVEGGIALLDAPVGSYYVPLGQPLANLAIAALEPDAPGSYFANGVILDLRRFARVMALPALKVTPVP